MRIDEFSNSSALDGLLTTKEQSRFLLFGFDISLAEVVLYKELMAIISPIQRSIGFTSLLTLDQQLQGLMAISIAFDSKLEK